MGGGYNCAGQRAGAGTAARCCIAIECETVEKLFTDWVDLAVVAVIRLALCLPGKITTYTRSANTVLHL